MAKGRSKIAVSRKGGAPGARGGAGGSSSGSGSGGSLALVDGKVSKGSEADAAHDCAAPINSNIDEIGPHAQTKNQEERRLAELGWDPHCDPTHNAQHLLYPHTGSKHGAAGAAALLPWEGMPPKKLQAFLADTNAKGPVALSQEEVRVGVFDWTVLIYIHTFT